MKVKLLDVDLIRRYGSCYLNADPGVAAVLIRKKLAIDCSKPTVVALSSTDIAEVVETPSSINSPKGDFIPKPTESVPPDSDRPILRAREKVINNSTIFPKGTIKES